MQAQLQTTVWSMEQEHLNLQPFLFHLGQKYVQANTIILLLLATSDDRIHLLQVICQNMPLQIAVIQGTRLRILLHINCPQYANNVLAYMYMGVKVEAKEQSLEYDAV